MSRGCLQKCKGCLVLVAVLLASINSLPTTGAGTLPTTIKVFPYNIVVDERDILLTSPITVKITVLNVIGLYAWQIKLYFNSTVLNSSASSVWYPPNHIFASRKYVEVTAAIKEDEGGTYILFASTLLRGEEAFDGSGILCQINFTRIAMGSSSLRFSKPLGEDTSLLDRNREQIPFFVVDGGIGSTITTEVEPSTVSIGQYVTISGHITPTRAAAKVTIHYRMAGATWDVLTTVETNSHGEYSHSWRTTKEGKYEIRSSWPGDENTNSAISEAKPLLVKSRPNIAPYVATAIVALIVVALYLARIRKHQLHDNKHFPKTLLESGRP